MILETDHLHHRDVAVVLDWQNMREGNHLNGYYMCDDYYEICSHFQQLGKYARDVDHLLIVMLPLCLTAYIKWKRVSLDDIYIESALVYKL